MKLMFILIRKREGKLKSMTYRFRRNLQLSPYNCVLVFPDLLIHGLADGRWVKVHSALLGGRKVDPKGNVIDVR